jgi:hypothetical protein
MMVQGKGITAKWGAGFCFRAVHAMAATARDAKCVIFECRSMFLLLLL